MKITIEDKHIIEGTLSCFTCAVARAMNEQCPLGINRRWYVDEQSLGVSVGLGRARLLLSWPDDLQVWIDHWDRWKAYRVGTSRTKTSAPGAFAFEVPDSIINTARKVA